MIFLRALRVFARSLLPLLASASVPAAFAQPEPQAVAFARDAGSGVFTLSWAGAFGRTYFIQNSFDLLVPWHYLPVIESGAGAPLAFSLLVDPPAPRVFLRLRYTDQPHGGDPYSFDFSGGGLPAGWALEQGLDPFDSAAAGQLAPHSGGLTQLQFFQQSQGPGADPVTTNALGLLVSTP